VLLTTAEALDGERAPLEVSPPDELRCPVVPGVEPCERAPTVLAPLVVPEAVTDEPLTEPVAVPAALGAALVAGVGDGATVADGAGTGAVPAGVGGAGGVDGVP
jgi:hypothetical protein